MSKILESSIDKVKDIDLLAHIQKERNLKRSGNNYVGACPSCMSKSAFNVTPSKNAFKCFACEEFKGEGAIYYEQLRLNLNYIESVELLASEYHIPLEREESSAPIAAPKKKKDARKTTRGSFRDRQLKASGLKIKDLSWYQQSKGEEKTKRSRFEAKSLDHNREIEPGNDMIIHYLDLDGKPMTYEAGNKTKPYVRVRWEFPALHKKDGKEVRYESMPGAKSRLYIPNKVIRAYKQAEIIETLYVLEGEKKAEKACAHGMYAVGLSGINNFNASDAMPKIFQRIIQKNNVQNIVFLLDGDWKELKAKPHKSADVRPKQFFAAVKKFRKYFAAYALENIYLNLFFGYTKSTTNKGLDDILVNEFKGKEDEFVADIEDARVERAGEGKYVNLHDITTLSEYKIKEFWHIQNFESFKKAHFEELKAVGNFTYNKLKYHYNKDTNDIEMLEQILQHEKYWSEVVKVDRNGIEKTSYQYDYANMRNFLVNRGFAKYKTPAGTYRFIHQENGIVREIETEEIQEYIINYTEEIGNKQVLNLILRGAKQYLGPNALSNMYRKTPEFITPDKDTQYFIFKNCYWKITKDKIIQRPLSELPAAAWADKQIQHEVNLLEEPLAQVTRVGDQFKVKVSKQAKESDIANFYFNTSYFNWRKSQKLYTDKNGKKYYGELSEDDKQPIPTTPEELTLNISNMAAKMVAAGYILHDYTDYSALKAIILNDGLESEVGRSQGGSGKGVFMSQFEHVVPVYWIDGKRKNLEEDNHLFAGVDERTQLIYVEDVRVNFNFEAFFPTITRAIHVNPKGEKATKVKPKKVAIDTNHSLNGEGNSFNRRQYNIAFSDYYNEHRTVGDVAKRQFYHDWNDEQWNYFYNWLAVCVQTFLRFRLNYAIPTDMIERRKLRQAIGEDFINWAELYYHKEPDDVGKTGRFLNHKINKAILWADFAEKHKKAAKYMDERKFKKKFEKYAKYAGLEYNPIGKGDKRMIKSNGVEYIILADKSFNSNQMETIRGQIQLDRLGNHQIGE